MNDRLDSSPVPEERVAVLDGDRLCTGCSYNLAGQFVVREPHYGLLVVRCPECGAVASIQEYPLLGRWAARWGVVLAVHWFVVLLAAWFGSSGLVCGFTLMTAEDASREYGRHVRQLHEEWQATQAPPTAPNPASTTLGPMIVRQGAMPADTFDEWWRAHDRDAVLAAYGGWARAIDWRAIVIWIPAGFVLFAAGWFWSVALLQLRRRWLLLWAAPIMLVGALFAGVQVWDWVSQDNFRAWRAGRDQIGPAMVVITLGYCALPLVIGMLAGRPLTRALVRALLPPRLRGSLAILWTSEGLAIPPGRTPRA